jgi:hypothetical protein
VTCLRCHDGSSGGPTSTSSSSARRRIPWPTGRRLRRPPHAPPIHGGGHEAAPAAGTDGSFGVPTAEHPDRHDFCYSPRVRLRQRHPGSRPSTRAPTTSTARIPRRARGSCA